MNGRPAGMSDDEDEYNEYYYDFPRKRVGLTTNGGPKSMTEAVKSSDIKALQQFISLALRKKISINYDKLTNDSPLIIACSTKWVDGVELLLKSGADPNVKKELVTPLAVCCNSNCMELAECVQLLLKYGADVNVKNQHGQVPLIIAAQSNSIEVVKVLLESSDIDINITDPIGRTALFYARENGNTVVADLLISAGINTQVIDKYSKLAADVQPTNPREVERPTVLVSSLFEYSVPQAHSRTEEFADLLENQKIGSFLSLLPDKNGDGGFGDLVQSFFAFAGIPELTLNNCQLPDLLLGDEEILIKLGVKLSHHRLRILKAAHRFHCCRWSPASILDLKNNSLLSTDGIGQIIANILMHLVSIRCSLLYLHKRLAASGDSTVNSDIQKDLIIKLVELYGTQITIKNKLESVLDQINKMRSISECPIDYIGNKKKRSITFKFFSATLSIVGISYFYFFAKRVFL